LNASSTEFSQWEYQTIALAASMQAAVLVQKLAWHGEVDEEELLATLKPLWVMNTGSTADVYPSVNAFSTGLRTLQEVLAPESARHMGEIANYALSMLVLRGRLNRHGPMQQTIRQQLAGLDGLTLIASDPDPEAQKRIRIANDYIYKQLARLYQDTISKFSYRIQVKGKVEYLQQDDVANRIRALLLAGIRSAVLWHQLGGRRWTLLLRRRRIRETAADIRRKLIATI